MLLNIFFNYLQVVTQFLRLETLLDDSVGRKIDLEIERGGVPLTVKLQVFGNFDASYLNFHSNIYIMPIGQYVVFLLLPIPFIYFSQHPMFLEPFKLYHLSSAG